MRSGSSLLCVLWATVITIVMTSGSAARAQCGCPGDVTGDDLIDVQDLVSLILDWGVCRGPCPASDLNDDGEVDVQDLTLVILNFGPCVESGGFPKMWINGENCLVEPSIQVHQYNDDLYILRQSLCTNFEGPFIYLLFGEEKVLMQDTGATSSLPIAGTVQGIIHQWLVENDQDSIELVVTHSHAHGDHTQGDSQMNGLPNSTVVGLSQSAVASFFGITNWPEQIVEYDLGGRIIDVIPIPGHHSTHVALYDRRTGILFTGDTLYPGRLYISNFSQYLQSIQRMVTFTEDKPLCWVLGTHIEMTNTPGEDFAFGATYHPDEHPLQLTRATLEELLAAVIAMQDGPFIDPHDDFIVWPLGVMRP